MSNIQANALVKRDNLRGPYGWIHEQGLLITQKLLVLDENRGVDLYQAYNIDTNQWAGVTSEDILLLDEGISQTKPSYPSAHHIIIEGPKLHIFVSNPNHI